MLFCQIVSLLLIFFLSSPPLPGFSAVHRTKTRHKVQRVSKRTFIFEYCTIHLSVFPLCVYLYVWKPYFASPSSFIHYFKSVLYVQTLYKTAHVAPFKMSGKKRKQRWIIVSVTVWMFNLAEVSLLARKIRIAPKSTRFIKSSDLNLDVTLVRLLRITLFPIPLKPQWPSMM